MMPPEPSNPLRQKLLSTQGLVALVGVLTLVIGFFVGSAIGRLICATIVVGIVLYLFKWWQNERDTSSEGGGDDSEDVPQSSGDEMKTLLFDDLQGPSSSYVVKEVENDVKVVPSTKTGEAAPVLGVEEKRKEFDISDFFDLDSDVFRGETEPRSEFNFLMNKLLAAMKDVLFAHTVAFFWANREKQQMVLEASASDSGNLLKARRFDIGDDILSQVAKSGRPQILGRVNPTTEAEMLHYYESPEEIKSAIVVPVYFMTAGAEQLPVGVLAADSKAEDAFGAETLSLLGKFTKHVSALIKSYTDKYDLLLDSELLSSIRRMQDRVKSDASEARVLEALADEATRLVSWDSLTVTMYSEQHNGWAVQKLVNRTGLPYVAPDTIVDFNASIVGKVIKNSAVEQLGDMSAGELPRFVAGESIGMSGSFLCVPITSLSRCYGAVALESRNKHNFSGKEVETLYRLVENAAMMLEVLYMNDMVKDHVIVDHITGALTKKYFFRKVDEEVQRAEDFGTDLAFVGIAVDGKQELLNRYGKESFDSLMNEISSVVRRSLRPYDVVGRWDLDQLGVLLLQTAGKEGLLWAEKRRQEVMSHIVNLSGKSFSVTISAGVCGLTQSMSKEELISNATQVLHRAVESGGNVVRVF